MDMLAQQREIIDRRDLIAELDIIAAKHRGDGTAQRLAVLEALKACLTHGQAEIRRRFESGAPGEAGASGEAVYRASSFLIDQLVRVTYDFAYEYIYPISNPTAGERQAVVAVGGYGREEMAPFSDVDLLFLTPYKATPHTEQVVEYVLYMLWDLGLKVGHSTRSIDDCIRLAAADTTIGTALLEARYLWGDAALFHELRRRFRDDVAAGSGPDFVEAKLAERDARHQRMGDSRYVLEPNIKDGKGGLRDLHTLFWIAKFLYGVDEMRDLVGKGVFTAPEAARFRRAHAFLATLRCHLHYVSERAEERLTFDLQPVIGRRMRYTDHAGTRGVERFMKHYYLVAKTVGDLTRIFCAAIEAEQHSKPISRFNPFRPRRREIDGFIDDGGRLTVASDTAFADDPVNFIRLFHTAQAHELDIHPAALRLITRNIDGVDAGLRADPEANRLFVEILTSPNGPEIPLRRMSEGGVFGRFLPDFGRVIAQMQYDMYHVYTVDEHTIRAIGLLHGIEAGRYKDDHPLSTEVVRKIQSRRVLYLAVLFHDVAKGRGGDHSTLGAEVALKECPRLGLNEWETDTVAWLVRHHLAMSSTAQKRDIDDPKTISDFAELVQSPERLRLLLVLTVVDMRATGPAVWNAWKAALLRELYHRTVETILGEATGQGVRARVAAKKAAARAALSGWDDADVEAFLGLGYDSFWLALDTETHLRHAALITTAERDDNPLAIHCLPDPSRDITEVTVYTPDHPGLFSRIAGGLALAGANIVNAKIFTLTNGKALDTFWVQDRANHALAGPAALERLRKKIEAGLTGRLRPAQELAKKRPALPPRTEVFRVAPRVLIDNEASATYTVIEVNGRDRPGLLYAVTQTLTDLGLQIASAKISTFGERVVDVFYVKDVFGMQVRSDRKLAQIREALLETLSDLPAGPAPATAADDTVAAK